ncbi:MAG: amidohydrolase family protein [Deltaproteobacteria bacterium]|nr:amidohydrolase family protein [Deltaproteobacteria bacterium]
MQQIDLLIVGGEVINAFSRRFLDVAVSEGKVVGLLNSDAPKPPARKVIQAKGLYVLPGAIDPHTHLGSGAKVFGNIPATMKACTQALALGGTTTVMEMIPPKKGMTLFEGASQARAEREGNMAIDFAFHPSIPSSEDSVMAQLENCADEGIASFHASFEGSRGREALNEGILYHLLTLARERRMMMIVHAEDSRLNEAIIKQTPNAGAVEKVSSCRPWLSETSAVRRAVFVSELTRGPLYFEHLGAGPSLNAVRSARLAGLPVYAETCPHYLCFSEEIYKTSRGVEFLKSPPLRRKADVEALWRGIQDGTISSVATDESLALLQKKREATEQLPAYQVSGGLNQIELRLAVMQTEMVVRRGMPIEKVVHCLATGPAMVFGLYPRKGTIEIGSDADLVLFDPKVTRKIRNEDLHQGTDYTIFEGWQVQGIPRMTILRGTILAEDGCIVGPDDGGQWLARKIDPSVTGGPAA